MVCSLDCKQRTLVASTRPSLLLSEYGKYTIVLPNGCSKLLVYLLLPLAIVYFWSTNSDTPQIVLVIELLS